MDCIKTICLYIKKYISDEQFETIFYDYLGDFQNVLEEDIYLGVLFTNLSRKEEKISLQAILRNYVSENYGSLYENINDAYVERLIDTDTDDVVVQILRKKYEKREKAEIDCSLIRSQSELIDSIKQSLQYPSFCGNNWDAIEDLMYDIIFPQKLIFRNWCEVEKKLPQDAAILRALLERRRERCVIIYA